MTYEALLGMNQTQRRELISGAETVYIYHSKIDATGDKPATEKQVFEACAAALEELKTLVRLVVNTMNGSNIIITSDHGFLYSHEPLNESDKASTGLVSGGIIEAGKRYIIADSDARSNILTVFINSHRCFLLYSIYLRSFSVLVSLQIVLYHKIIVL